MMTDISTPVRDRSGSLLLPVTFTATIFLSAALLFFVQPLFAKIALPVIGGAPAVWTTAMLFFQTVLIAGYLYAHLSTRLLPPRAQIALHMALWALALFFLPPALPDGWKLDASGSIAFQTLGLFALGVGAPFALLSSNAPLIQSWYARSGGISAQDPYFLYGASNLGSLVALLAFPLVAERHFGAGQIAFGFAGGFVALGAGLAACGGSIFALPASSRSETSAPTASIPATRLLHWLILAFVPSSLMLAVTAKVSTDLGAIPLIWVIPLALFLLTFVVTFTGRTPFRGPWLTRLAQLSAVAAICAFTGLFGDHLSLTTTALLITAFFLITPWCHRTLYEARPDAGHLTLFYVTMSLGGALGGLFNSLLAPWLFVDLLEGTATVLVALLLTFQPMLNLAPRSLLQGGVVGTITGLALTAIALAITLPPFGLAVWIMAAIVILTALYRKSLNLLAVPVFLTALLPAWLSAPDHRLLADRSFFGPHQVLDQDNVRYYMNGTTIHGAQVLDAPDSDRPVPSSYYHAKGPMGQILTSDKGRSSDRIGIVGLGVGALACHAQPGQNWHFYEIDAMVDRVARDPALFTYLSRCTPDAPTHLGDARVVLETQQNLTFDVLVIDAYSSDAVPVHLTTLEAMKLYLDRLSEDGILVYHVSNRYYDIGLPLARAADSLGLGIWRQSETKRREGIRGYLASDVVMLSRSETNVAELLASETWTALASDGGALWTDDKANPLSILRPGVLWD